MTHLVILDRDGVINQDSEHFVKSPQEWVPIPGSLDAIARLNQAGVKVAVATNQSGLARRLFTVEALDAMHAKLRRLLRDRGGHIDALVYCPHGPADGCDCRKPRAGLYRQVATRLSMPLAGVPVIGDSGRDLDAALAVAADPILVLTGKGRVTATQRPDLAEIPRFVDLAAAVDWLLEGRRFR